MIFTTKKKTEKSFFIMFSLQAKCSATGRHNPKPAIDIDIDIDISSIFALDFNIEELDYLRAIETIKPFKPPKVSFHKTEHKHQMPNSNFAR